MQEIVIKTSVWKAILILFISAAFVAGGIFTILRSNDLFLNIIGIIGIVFFGVGFFVLLYHVSDRRPRIIIDEKGITDRTLGIGRIDWEDIESVDLASVSSTKFVVLYLKDTGKYLKRLSNTSRKITKINKMLGFGALNLNLSLIDMKPQSFFNLIESRINEN
jgi:hypothetical protein